MRMINVMLATTALVTIAPTGRVCAQQDVRRLTVKEYVDKMKAGWIGQMAGVGLGGPTEFRKRGEIIPENEMPVWRPGLINPRNDSKSLKISVPRRLIADFELFGRTKTGLFDREQNIARRKDLPKYEVKNIWNLQNKYKVVHPPDLFQTLDKTQPHVRLTELEPLQAAAGTKAAGGGPFSVAGKRYYDGIVMDANGELVYAFRPEWKEFVATVGIDDSQRADPQASIVCRVVMEDAAGKTRTLAESPAMKSGDRKAHHFNVPLPGNCVKVRLETGAAGGGGDSHRADWVNAGFRKE